MTTALHSNLDKFDNYKSTILLLAASLSVDRSSPQQSWLNSVAMHFHILLDSLPPDPFLDASLCSVLAPLHYETVFELVLLSLDLTGPPEAGNEGNTTPSSKLEYSSLSRTLIIRTIRALGIDLVELENVEKAVAQNLYFALKAQEGGGEGEERKGQDWEQAAQNEKEKSGMDRKKKTMRWLAAGAGMVVGGAVIGLTGGLAAPLIAPVLAGTLGLGIFGGAAGTVLIGTLFGLGGGGLASYRAHRRFRDLEEFTFEPVSLSPDPDLPQIPSLTVTIVCSGFLLDKEDSVDPWKRALVELSRERGRESTEDCFALKVETEAFLEAGRAFDSYLRDYILAAGGVEILKQTILAGLLLPLTVIQGATFLLDSEFSRCKDKSQQAGILLAEILSQKIQGTRPCTLIGYGPGALTIFSCLLELSRRRSSTLSPLLFDVILISLPSAPTPTEWQSATKVVSNRLINCYSTNDWVLAVFARMYNFSVGVAGLGEVGVEGVLDLDCTAELEGGEDAEEGREGGGHLRIRWNLGAVLRRCRELDELQ